MNVINRWKTVPKELRDETMEHEYGWMIKYLLESCTTHTFYFSEDGCKDLGSVCNCNGILLSILSGNSKIVKLPWKPKKDERYWWYSYVGEAPCSTKWKGSYSDLFDWKVGNCFRTKKEAEAKGKEIMEQIMKEYKEA